MVAATSDVAADISVGYARTYDIASTMQSSVPFAQRCGVTGIDAAAFPRVSPSLGLIVNAANKSYRICPFSVILVRTSVYTLYAIQARTACPPRPTTMSKATSISFAAVKDRFPVRILISNSALHDDHTSPTSHGRGDSGAIKLVLSDGPDPRSKYLLYSMWNKMGPPTHNRSNHATGCRYSHILFALVIGCRGRSCDGTSRKLRELRVFVLSSWLSCGTEYLIVNPPIMR